MYVLHIISHHDDEFAAYPLIQSYIKQNAKQEFVFMTACGDSLTAARRQRESLNFLSSSGIDTPVVNFIGSKLGIPTYELYRNMPLAQRALEPYRSKLGKDDLIVTHAWEGGHVDHDCCHALACWLSEQLGGRTIIQFALYNMKGLRWPLFWGASPITENGSAFKAQMRSVEWVRFISAARFYPTQWKVLVLLLPSMALTFILNGGYYYQTVSTFRFARRPHEGRLMYEQTGSVYFERILNSILPMFESTDQHDSRAMGPVNDKA